MCSVGIGRSSWKRILFTTTILNILFTAEPHHSLLNLVTPDDTVLTLWLLPGYFDLSFRNDLDRREFMLKNLYVEVYSLYPQIQSLRILFLFYLCLNTWRGFLALVHKYDVMVFNDLACHQNEKVFMSSTHGVQGKNVFLKIFMKYFQSDIKK